MNEIPFFLERYRFYSLVIVQFKADIPALIFLQVYQIGFEIRDLARESTSFLTFHVLPPSLPRSSPTSHVDVSSKASLQPNPTFPEYFDPPTLQVFALFEGFSFFFFLSIPPVFFPSFYHGMAGWIREGYKAFLPTQKGVVNEIRLSLFFFLFFNLSTSLLRCMHGFEIFIII